MFTLDFDSQSRILSMRGWGFWSAETLAAFSADLLREGKAFRRRHGPFAMLNDVRDMPVQLPDVARGLEQLLTEVVKITTAPMANVAGSALSKIQIDRILCADHVRTFLTIEEARAWLAERWPNPAGN